MSDRLLKFDEDLVETEEGSEHPGLSAQVGSGNPEHLSFASHLHTLNTCNHSTRLSSSAALAWRAIAASRADDRIRCDYLNSGEFADDRYGAVGPRSAIPESRRSSFEVCPWRTHAEDGYPRSPKPVSGSIRPPRGHESPINKNPPSARRCPRRGTGTANGQ